MILSYDKLFFMESWNTTSWVILHEVKHKQFVYVMIIKKKYVFMHMVQILLKWYKLEKTNYAILYINKGDCYW